MKTILLYLVLILFSLVSKSQEDNPHYEFGPTLLTVNSLKSTNHFNAGKPAVEYVNGLFFRYRVNRFSYRFLGSYSDNTVSFSDPPGTPDGGSSEENNKDIRFGFGAQFSLINEKDWFYVYTDVLYRNVYSSGFFSGGFGGTTVTFTSDLNGIDSFLGVGFKLKIFKSVYVSPELGHNFTFSKIDRTSTLQRTGQVMHSTFSQFDFTNNIKIHITVAF